MTDKDQDYVQNLLNFDALHEAEKLTGEDYKSDEETSRLGFQMHILHAQQKSAALQVRGDTYHGIKFQEAIDVALGLGFTPVWSHSGLSAYDNPQETVFLWSDDGILLTMNDYHGDLNDAYISFNWRPSEGGTTDFMWSLPFSGGMEHRSHGFDDVEGDPWVFVVGIHVVAGLRHYVEKLRSEGELLSEWYVTDDLLRVRIGKEHESDYSDPKWHDKIKDQIRARVGEFDEPARSAIQAGMFGKDWE